MARTDANPPMPEWSTEYQLVEVDADFSGDLDLTELASQVGAGGKMMLGYIVPDMSALAKYAYDVTIADFNLGEAHNELAAMCARRGEREAAREKEAYEAGLNQFKQGNYGAAIAAFQGFMTSFANSALLPSWFHT